MVEDPKAVLRDGQWLGSGDLYADYGDTEMMVAMESGALDHPILADLSDNEHGQSVQSSRDAMHLASLAATNAKNRGNVDANGKILVAVEDLEAVA